jgi:RNA polymerase sigma-70 factor (ECF subfamily)
MKTKLKDNELVGKFIDGDKSAFEKLINRHKERVYSYILFIVKNEELAEDIFQDTFIKVIKSLKKGKYNEQGVFVSWVIRIAHNLTIDYFRKDSRMPVYNKKDKSDFDIFNSKQFSEDTIEDEIIKEQIAQEVRNLIEKLPDEQKEVILLRHYGNLSFKEIAEQTNVSINTALGRMRYALINLRKLIEDSKLDLSII